jgi:hypothetical protein
MKAVQALQDDNGHWYLIPNELEERFNDLLEELYSDDNDFDDDYDNLSEKFDDLFSEYRTGGDLNLVQLYIDEL